MLIDLQHQNKLSFLPPEATVSEQSLYNTSFKALLCITTDKHKDMEVKGTLDIGTLQLSAQKHAHVSVVIL